MTRITQPFQNRQYRRCYSVFGVMICWKNWFVHSIKLLKNCFGLNQSQSARTLRLSAQKMRHSRITVPDTLERCFEGVSNYASRQCRTMLQCTGELCCNSQRFIEPSAFKRFAGLVALKKSIIVQGINQIKVFLSLQRKDPILCKYH